MTVRSSLWRRFAQLILVSTIISVSSFSSTSRGPLKTPHSGESKAVTTRDCPRSALTDGSRHRPLDVDQIVRRFVLASVLTVTTATGLIGFSGGALADEYGKETEAPTLFTGETVMICKKRGPLGACQETVVRTAENDNDKASKYFRDPSQLIKDKEAAMRASDDSEGNELIRKLRQKSEDNKERNELLVQQKTFENDQSANFGPFDRKVVIMNTDGRTFTLLQSPQAMRLKKAGFIKDRKFVKQPTQEEIDEALESPDFGDTVKGFFGGGGAES